ncbi:hypothetical protein [Paenibacillus sp. N3.4]|nr:hypothetical protein [Paenibacillus sp. N3.4]
MKAITPMTFIEIQIGSQLLETDIWRITETWEESVQLCGNSQEQ